MATRYERGERRRTLGVAVLVLLELALAGRLEVREGRVTVVDPAPAGDPVIDEAFAEIRADQKTRGPRTG